MQNFEAIRKHIVGEECTRELFEQLNKEIKLTQMCIASFEGLLSGLEQRYEAVAEKIEGQLRELQSHREQIEMVLSLFKVAMLPMQERLVLDSNDRNTREMWELLGGSANNNLILKSKMQQLTARFNKQVKHEPHPRKLSCGKMF